MKKLIFIIASIALVSCKKEEPKPTQATPPTTVNEACKCGIVTSKFYTFSTAIWTTTVQNNCSGAYKDFKESFPKEIGTVYCSNESW